MFVEPLVSRHQEENCDTRQVTEEVSHINALSQLLHTHTLHLREVCIIRPGVLLLVTELLKNLTQELDDGQLIVLTHLNHAQVVHTCVCVRCSKYE